MNANHSPRQAMVLLILAVLGAELAIMLLMECVIQPIFHQRLSSFDREFFGSFLTMGIMAPILYRLVFRPMLEQRQEIEQQRDGLAIAAVTFDAQAGVMVTDENGRIMKVNHLFTEITGYSNDEVVGKMARALHLDVQDAAFYRRVRAVLLRDKFWQGEILSRRKNGETFPEWLSITATTGHDGHRRYVSIFNDITEQKANEERIRFMAYHDPLTRLPNRELFLDRLSLAMARVGRDATRMSLLFIDIDGFKPINDTFGHAAGDEVLKLTAARLLGCVREVDTVARLGGDEFAVILEGVGNPRDVEKVIRKIQARLAEPTLLAHDRGEGIHASIGMAICPRDGIKADQLIHVADAAMYTVKASRKMSPQAPSAAAVAGSRAAFKGDRRAATTRPFTQRAGGVSAGRSRDEPQGDRIHAIAQASGARAIVEHVPEVAVAACAADGGARHAKTAVAKLDHVAAGNRLPEAGPAGAGVEFGGRIVQRRPAGDAAEQALGRWLLVLAIEGHLSPVASHDLVGRRRKALAPLRIGQDQPGHLTRAEIPAVVAKDLQQHVAGLADRRAGGGEKPWRQHAAAGKQQRTAGQRGTHESAAVHGEGFIKA
jgi:diguanylate cyclase (GGDEF)-like protein/PAS domain S-box-containing protein